MKDLGLIAYSGPIDDVQKRKSFDVILDAEIAAALAQFLKRVTFSTCERHAAGIDEAYRINAALSALRRVVNEAGFDPR